MSATFTVEDGTGLSTANAFIDVAYLKQYNDDNENVPAVDKSDDTRKEKSIRIATAKIRRDNESKWRGSRWTETQALPYPRTDFVDQDGWSVRSGSNGTTPTVLSEATAELSVAWLNGDTFDAAYSPEIESLSYSNEEKSESVGYRGAGRAGTTKNYPKVAKLLKRLLHSGGLVEPG